MTMNQQLHLSALEYVDTKQTQKTSQECELFKIIEGVRDFEWYKPSLIMKQLVINLGRP